MQERLAHGASNRLLVSPNSLLQGIRFFAAGIRFEAARSQVFVATREYFTDRPVPITDSTPRKAFAIFTTDLDELRSIVHSIEEWVLTECGGEALEKGAPMPGKVTKGRQ
eukprot:COSAG04_NODE_1614_length_6164_cov_66.962737_4_plen_110_part_00